MMYTDEEIKRVAEWLGLIVNEGDYAELFTYDGRIGSTSSKETWRKFASWLRSSDGRCAIEDRFMEEPSNPSPRHYVNEPFRIYWPCREWIGEGATVAAAWLDAAVKYTEVET